MLTIALAVLSVADSSLALAKLDTLDLLRGVNLVCILLPAASSAVTHNVF